MDGAFVAAEPKICRSFREACTVAGSTVLRGLMGGDPAEDFARSAAATLACVPRSLDSRFLYDADGSALFELITKQPEYYLTRAEASILAACSGRIREVTGPVTLLELGSGNSAKTHHLLRAWLKRDARVRYVPVDVSESTLIDAGSAINAAYRGVKVIGLNCDFQGAFPLLPLLSPVMVLLLGSTIGNFAPDLMSSFLGSLAAALSPGDFFLIGIDLVKDPALLEAAYNDKAGVTARFTRNVFARMNRELGCSLDLESIEHLARWDAEREQIEIFGRFTRKQTMRLATPGVTLTVSEGELVQTEISRKFRRERLIPYLEQFGFRAEQVFDDERGWFSLVLLRRTSDDLQQPRAAGGNHDSLGP